MVKQADKEGSCPQGVYRLWREETHIKHCIVHTFRQNQITEENETR